MSVPKGILVFYLFDVILFVVLVLSLLVLKSGTKKSEGTETAIVNPKYKDSIAFVRLSFPLDDDTLTQRRIVLSRSKSGENAWFGFMESPGADGSSSVRLLGSWPCDLQTVDNLLFVSTNVMKMYKKAVIKSSWPSLSLDAEHAVVVSYLDVSGGELSTVYFGSEDPLTQRIYLRGSGSPTVYSADGALATYLNPSPSFWADPYLYPRAFTGDSAAAASSLLRRGSLASPDVFADIPEDNVTVLHKDFGNGGRIYFSAAPFDDSYIVSPKFVPGPAQDGSLGSLFDYAYMVSSWTMEKLRKECEKNEL